MLNASNIEKSYGGQSLFEGASFVMGRGERVGLVGRNGSGKTTLFRMILGKDHPDSGAISSPTGYRIGHLQQHLSFTLPSVIAEACQSLAPTEDGRDETYRAESILMGLGFTEAMMQSDPMGLSGGFQIRLNLAKLLIAEPDMLLLDEPTNYLDLPSIRWLGRFLRSYNGEFIIITHDRMFMDSVTTHTMAIHRRKIVKMPGGTAKLYDTIAEQEEHHERMRMNDERKRAEAERFINRFRAQATRARAVQSRIKQLGRKERLERLSMESDLDFKFNSAPFIGKWMLQCEGLAFGYPGADPLFSGVSIDVKPGDRIAVIGRNGAGKSTLLNLIAGNLAPTSGTVRLNEKSKPAFFGQTNIDRLNPAKTIVDELVDAHPDMTIGRARNIAGLMMFEGDTALKKIKVLSGGERSRVMLGKLLINPANMLLLDEPTNHLDMQSIDSLLAAIDNFPGAVIIVTHSEMILEAIAERLIVFDTDGVSVFEGTYLDFLQKKGFLSEGGTSARTRGASAPSKGTSPHASAPSKEGTSAPTQPAAPKALSKDQKRMRASLIDERSRTLNPLAKKIASLEEQITTLEAKVETDTAALIAASSSGDADAIASHSRSMQEARDRIERLFTELAEATEQHDSMSTDFERRLADI